MGCNILLPCRRLSAFRMNILPPSSGRRNPEDHSINTHYLEKRQIWKDWIIWCILCVVRVPPPTFSPKCPDLVWGPSILKFIRYWCSFAGVKRHGCEVDHSLRLWMSGALPPLLLYALVAWRGTISPFTPTPPPPVPLPYLLRPESSFRPIFCVFTCPPAPCVFIHFNFSERSFRNIVCNSYGSQLFTWSADFSLQHYNLPYLSLQTYQ